MIDLESAERAEQTSAEVRRKLLGIKTERLHRNRYALQTYKTGVQVSIFIKVYSSSLVLILWIITALELRCAAVM
jgi:hypothetical protein